MQVHCADCPTRSRTALRLRQPVVSKLRRLYPFDRFQTSYDCSCRVGVTPLAHKSLTSSRSRSPFYLQKRTFWKGFSQVRCAPLGDIRLVLNSLVAADRGVEFQIVCLLFNAVFHLKIPNILYDLAHLLIRNPWNWQHVPKRPVMAFHSLANSPIK